MTFLLSNQILSFGLINDCLLVLFVCCLGRGVAYFRFVENRIERINDILISVRASVPSEIRLTFSIKEQIPSVGSLIACPETPVKPVQSPFAAIEAPTGSAEASTPAIGTPARRIKAPIGAVGARQLLFKL